MSPVCVRGREGGCKNWIQGSMHRRQFSHAGISEFSSRPTTVNLKWGVVERGRYKIWKSLELLLVPEIHWVTLFHYWQHSESPDSIPHLCLSTVPLLGHRLPSLCLWKNWERETISDSHHMCVAETQHLVIPDGSIIPWSMSEPLGEYFFTPLTLACSSVARDHAFGSWVD